ncbi:MAG: universal stress protein, partial [Comamonadaceae bacterium]
MRSLLVPIDPVNIGRTRSAVAEAVRIYRDDPVAIRLLRVQPRLNGHVAMFFGQRELRQLQQDSGGDDLQLARSLLDTAGVPYQATVLVGRSAE